MVPVMPTMEKIKSILAEHKEELAARFNVAQLGIFGSYVRGEQKRTSDIDVLVEFREPVGLFRFLDLEEYLTDLLGRKVDLVSKKALKPRIGSRILGEAVYI
jgi:hypothetical protein